MVEYFTVIDVVMIVTVVIVVYWLLTWTGSTVSRTTQSTSNLERMGSVRSTLSAKVMEGSYRPPMGFAAAITAHRA